MYLMTEEHKKNISLSRIGKPHPNRSHKNSEETKKKMSIAKKGIKFSEEHLKNLSLAHKGQIPWNWKGGKINQRRLERERRVRKMNAEGSHTEKQWSDLKEYYDFMCLCCKRKEPEIILTRDHVIPLINKGSDFIENIQPLCQSCNARKWTRTVDYRTDKSILDTIVKKAHASVCPTCGQLVA